MFDALTAQVPAGYVEVVAIGSPPASSEAVRRRMETTRQGDTPAELALRRELHRQGLRYRVDLSLPGVTRARPDIVFTRQKVAVFVDGCFWHMCPLHSTLPKANAEWWREKLEANVDRDRRHDQELTAARWRVVRVWEHDDPSAAAVLIEEGLLASRAGLDHSGGS